MSIVEISMDEETFCPATGPSVGKSNNIFQQIQAFFKASSSNGKTGKFASMKIKRFGLKRKTRRAHHAPTVMAGLQLRDKNGNLIKPPNYSNPNKEHDSCWLNVPSQETELEEENSQDSLMLEMDQISEITPEHTEVEISLSSSVCTDIAGAPNSTLLYPFNSTALSKAGESSSNTHTLIIYSMVESSMVDPSNAQSTLTMSSRKNQSCKLRRQSAYALLRDFRPAHEAMNTSNAEQDHHVSDNDDASLDYESDDFSHITLVKINESTASDPLTHVTVMDPTNSNQSNSFERMSDASSNLSRQQKKKIGRQMKHFHRGQHEIINYGII